MFEWMSARLRSELPPIMFPAFEARGGCRTVRREIAASLRRASVSQIREKHMGRDFDWIEQTDQLPEETAFAGRQGGGSSP